MNIDRWRIDHNKQEYNEDKFETRVTILEEQKKMDV